MAYILNKDKQITAIASLAEGMSIRAVERTTGVHRDTVMRLGVRVGEACAAFMDTTMRKLTCADLQLDEIWGFVGMKQKTVEQHDEFSERRRRIFGDQYTFVALDRPTKLVPCFRIGKRDKSTAVDFLCDLSERLSTRVQLSSDAFTAYADAVERGFGSEVDYGQIVKTFATSELAQRRYSPPDLFHASRSAIIGQPNMDRVCTSHIENQNLTMRMHIRRLTRLTNAYSKKLANFKAAVALHFAYYNFVKFHSKVRCTPAMAAGVVTSPMSVADLVELA